MFNQILKVAFPLLLAGILTSPGYTQSSEKATKEKFRISIDSKIDLSIGGQSQRLDVETKLVYSLARKGEKIALRIHSMAVDHRRNGQTKMKAIINRHRIKVFRNGQWQERKAGQLPRQAREQLKAYGEILTTIKVDSQGREMSRKRVAGARAEPFFKQNLIEHTRLFHAPFYGKKEKWKSPRVLAIGQGGLAKGKLSFQKVEKKDRSVKVEVSGTLRGKNKTAMYEFTDARYKIKGWAIYDREQKEWKEGRYNIEVEIDLAVREEKGKGEGKMVLTFERLESEKGK